MEYDGIDLDRSGLVLTLTVGKKIYIGDEIIITSLRTIGAQTKLHISAPRHIQILRDRLKAKIAESGIPWEELSTKNSQAMIDEWDDGINSYEDRRGI